MIGTLLIFLWIILICSAFGERICGLKQQSIENFILSSCVGLFVLSYTVFLIGVLGWLYKWIFITILWLSFFYYHKEIIAICKYFLTKFRKINNIFPTAFDKLLAILYFLAVIAALVKALAPEIGNDALAYHIAHPKIFVESHKIKAIAYARESLWPYFTEMLFTLGILLRGPVLAKLFHFASAVLLSMGIYAFGEKHFMRRSGLLAAVIFLLTPAIFTQAGYAYVDITLTLYAFMSLYFFYTWMDNKKLKNILLCGIFCGVCMSIKYLGIFIFICMTVLFLHYYFAERKNIIKAFTYFTIMSLLVCLPWYLRSYILTGNPVYPLFQVFFKNAWDMPIGIACNLAKNIQNLIFLPWSITMYPKTFGGEQVGILYLMFVPFIFLSDRIKNFKVKSIIVFAIIFAVIWFLTSQAARYIFPILPVLAILASLSIYGIFRLSRAKNFAIAALFIALTFNSALAFYHTRDGLKVVLGLESEESYLMRKERSYAISKYINENTEPSAKIFTTEPRVYYCDRNIIYTDGYIACNKLSDVSFNELTKILKKDNFTHILLAVERPFSTSAKDISPHMGRIIYQTDFIENTPEDRRYILLKL